MVVAEVVYVLTSPRIGYQLNPEEIRARLRPVLSLPGLKFSQKRTCLRALDLYAHYRMLDFEDVFCVAAMERANIAELLSYDRGFDRVQGIIRWEP